VHDGPEQAGHDLRVHGELADRVVVMAYERSGSSGAPAPVAPLPEVREAVRCALSEIPRGKLLLGVPLFGYDWCLPSESNGRARRLGLDEARELAESRGAAIEYDSLRESAHFRYSDDDGREHVVWFEDERSLLAKFDLVRAWGLRGVSFWRLPGGGELPWRLVRDLFLVAGEEDAERVSAA
jgi:spore germination protein